VIFEDFDPVGRGRWCDDDDDDDDDEGTDDRWY
jgi:hypothetical protein